MFDRIFLRYEKSRRAWAEHGGRWNWLKLCFWSWLYHKQNVPNNGSRFYAD